MDAQSYKKLSKKILIFEKFCFILYKEKMPTIRDTILSLTSRRAPELYKPGILYLSNKKNNNSCNIRGIWTLYIIYKDINGFKIVVG